MDQAPLVSVLSGDGWELRCGHVLDALAGMEAGSVDVICTSPPYNIGVRYDGAEDLLPRGEYLDLMGATADELSRVLSLGGSLFLNLGGARGDPWLSWDVARLFGERLTLQNTIHWAKSSAIGDEAHGHYRPVGGARFLHGAHEYIFHFTHRGDVELDRLAIGVPYRDANNMVRWRNASVGHHCRGNVWFIPYETTRRAREHPATFPVALPDMCIRLHGVGRAHLVLDPFCGVGTTGVAAMRLDIPFVGIDVSKRYCELAREALEVEAVRTGGRFEQLTLAGGDGART